MVQTKKIVLYVFAVFVLYTIITSPARAADLVQIGFEGISSAAQGVGDFMTELVELERLSRDLGVAGYSAFGPRPSPVRGPCTVPDHLRIRPAHPISGIHARRSDENPQLLTNTAIYGACTQCTCLVML